MNQKNHSVKCKIDAVGTTTEKISGRAGFSLVSRYLTESGIVTILTQRFGFLKKHSKVTPLLSLFHQLLCFFFDGTDFHLTRFDQLKKDPGYAGVIDRSKNFDFITNSKTVFSFRVPGSCLAVSASFKAALSLASSNRET
jgi:hypothetical protein